MKSKEKVTDKYKGYGYILGYIKLYKWHYLIGLLAIITVDLITLQIPVVTGRITDGLQSATYTPSGLRKEVILMIILGLSVACIRFVWRYFIFGTSRKIEYRVRNDFFRHLEKLSLRFFHEHKTGDLMAYATNDLNAIRMLIGPGVLMALDTIVLTLLVVYQMISNISVKLTLLAVIPFPFIAIGSLLFGKLMGTRFKDKQEAFAHMSDMVQENISGIRVIKAFLQESKEIIAFNGINKNNYEKNMKVVKLQAVLFPFVMMIAGLSVAIVLGYGGYLAMIGELSLGSLVAFIQYLYMLIWPMIAFGWCINIISQGSASLARFQDILDEKPDIIDEEGVKEIHEIKGEIEFRNLNFRYPSADEDDLKDISFTLKQGETLGIVGRTGSGKTSLVNILLRMYNPKRGSVFIDGYDIMEIPLNVLRNSIGYVPQDNFLFSNTINNNIAFSKDAEDKDKVIMAAKQANVHDNIIEFKEQYETVVGERGVTLSGGQKQRISIARALIKEPNIMILDDAVSAVDTHTEEEILSHLREDRKDKTTIIIAHRISTLQNADKIIVLDQGQIIESGNHESLLAHEGLYYDMVIKQQLEKQLAEKE